MKSADSIRRVIQLFTWERWLERPYGTFVISLFAGANSRTAMERFGVQAEYRSCLFQENWWYESPDVTRPYAAQLRRYLQNGGSVFRISRACEAQYRRGLRNIARAVRSTVSVPRKLEVVRDALAGVMPFIWLAHGFEDVYTERLEREVPKHVDGDVATYIGDVTLPTKTTATTKMETAMRRGISPKVIVERFGWIKSRTGFSEPFTIAEIRSQQRKLIRQSRPNRQRRAVPPMLRRAVEEAREIVYLRTLRTDAVFELIYRARPVMHAAAKHYGLSFQELADYSIHDLIAGRPIPYRRTVFATDGPLFGFFRSPLVKIALATTRSVTGTIAFRGIVRGVARIVKHAGEADKVKHGDILVAPMTFQSLIMAMRRAAAFVTDEGGLTCHAAIVAREMHKPCIVGTKNATRVLKDGDNVEVDATKGVVRRLNR